MLGSASRHGREEAGERRGARRDSSPRRVAGFREILAQSRPATARRAVRRPDRRRRGLGRLRRRDRARDARAGRVGRRDPRFDLRRRRARRRVRGASILAQRGKLALDFGIGVFLWAAPLLVMAAWPSLWPAADRLRRHGNRELAGRHQRLHDPPACRARRGDGPGVRRAGERVHREMAIGALLMPLLLDLVGTARSLVIIGFGIAAVAPWPCRVCDGSIVWRWRPPGLELLRGVPILRPLPEPVLEPPRAGPQRGGGDRREQRSSVRARRATAST